MKRILKGALQELEQGKSAALAVIAGSQGSTPRTTGAAMVVGESGILAGTIGGGELEFQCAQVAMTAKQPLMHFELTNLNTAGLGMVCGGSTDVLFVPLKEQELLKRALSLLENLDRGWLLLPMDGKDPILETDEKLPLYPRLLERDGKTWLSLPLSEPGRIFLVGGGHVSVELAKILDVLEYPYFVADDRMEFSCRDRFPNAQRCITADFTRLHQAMAGPLTPGSQDCVCVMTRGHLGDMDALRFVLSTQAGYIGVMGSRRKRERIFASLTEEGFLDAADRIVTPIGLDIGGQTPAEIAISIAAQLIQWRSKARNMEKSAN